MTLSREVLKTLKVKGFTTALGNLFLTPNYLYSLFWTVSYRPSGIKEPKIRHSIAAAALAAQ